MTDKSYNFSWSFTLMTGVEKSYVQASETREAAEKKRLAYMAVLDEAMVYPAAKKKVFKICQAIGVRGGRIDSYFFGVIKESEA